MPRVIAFVRDWLVIWPTLRLGVLLGEAWAAFRLGTVMGYSNVWPDEEPDDYDAFDGFAEPITEEVQS